jgi:hypothetical protein
MHLLVVCGAVELLQASQEERTIVIIATCRAAPTAVKAQLVIVPPRAAKGPKISEIDD